MENEFLRVVDALPGLVWTALPDGHIDFLNQGWCEYTGISVEDAYGRGWQAVVHPDDLPNFLECWRRIQVSGRPEKIKARLRRLDGEYRRFVFHMNPLTDPSGQIVKWCGTSTECKERLRGDDTRNGRWWHSSPASEQHFLSIADGFPALVTLMKPSGELELVNRQVLEYFGKSLEELKRWTASDVVHPDDLPVVTAAWRRSIVTGEPYDIEHRIRRADGVFRWFDTHCFPLRDTAGRIVLWYHLQSDIDDRKRAEAVLAGEKRLLEMVASGHSMSAVLDALCHLVESIADGCYCSIMLVDPTGSRLARGAAPSLPKSFIEAIVGRAVNLDTGPCAMAAYLNEQVIADNLATETRWAAHEWCPMAIAHGLQACWSTPISSSTGRVLGAFAIYYDEPRSPTSLEYRLIEQLSHIANIAVDGAQADEALKRSEARKAAILSSALDCILTIDHEGRITEFNAAAERTFGYHRDDVLGQPLVEIIIPPSLREQHRRGFTRYLATGEEHILGRRVELTAMRADGSEFPIELAVTRIPLDGEPSFTGYLRDITERKLAEEALKRSEAFLAEGQHLAGVGNLSWHVATGDLIWSEQLYRIFEFKPGSPITLDLIATRVHPEDLPMMVDMIERALRGENDFEYQHRIIMPDESVKYLHLIAHRARHHPDQIEYIGAVLDITERRLSEEALNKARSELAHVTRVTSLAALTASIAHEVNQPLAGIVTNASTCLRMLAVDPPRIDVAQETARRTIRDGNRAADVIARLRALFGRRAAAIDSVDLNDAVREVIALSSGDLQRGRVILRTELGDHLPPVGGDRVQLQQVIMNLLRNAADAMTDVDDRPRQILLRTRSDAGNHVCLSVQDSGVGFGPEGAERIFEAFYTTKSDGMGIGLYVSRSIIESHNGRLWAEANDGPGATFSFSIPKHAGDEETTPHIGAIQTLVDGDARSTTRIS